uniref:Response regulator n=1 Tax=Phenylobacterium glaciei TaxID=2803784 RepID=A0A974P1L5_9CAUL|nr:response regulator [Phenylobacterium glaciei]
MPLRILAAEDNKTNQLILTSLLEPFGIDLTIAENGREAAELFAAGGYDLVLMDIQMPEMTGVEATLAIRQGEAERGVPPTPSSPLPPTSCPSRWPSTWPPA